MTFWKFVASTVCVALKLTLPSTSSELRVLARFGEVWPGPHSASTPLFTVLFVNWKGGSRELDACNITGTTCERTL